MTVERPPFEPRIAVLYDWLKANGVDEWIPIKPEIRVHGGKLSYRSFNWDGPRGWDAANLSPDQDDQPMRTVPLVVPMPNQRDFLAAQQLS